MKLKDGISLQDLFLLRQYYLDCYSCYHDDMSYQKLQAVKEEIETRTEDMWVKE